MVTGWPSRLGQRGVSMIEVLVTIFILVIALMALGRLQARLQVSEMESYQRAQALILVKDMASRMLANRRNAASYVTSSPLGGSSDCPTSGTARRDADWAEWCDLLKGAGERDASSARVGAMLGGRGCIVSTGLADEYRITVAWQGLIPVSLPANSPACGSGSYNGTGTSACINDLCRRIVSTLVRVGSGV